MATCIQVLLPLLCVAFAQAQFNLHLPLGLSGDLPPPPPPPPGLPGNHPQSESNEENFSHDSWFHHNWPRHMHRPHDRFNPFHHGGRDPYYGMDYGIDNVGPMPGISNIFNMPHMSGYNSHKRKPLHRKDDQQPKNHINYLKGGPSDGKIKAEDDNSKLNNTDSDMQGARNRADKDKNDVNIAKKKDFLLVGQGNNGNNIYLLHENKPNPNPTVAIPNQPGKNVMYVTYNPGQPNNQYYQVVSAQPAPLQNGQVSQNKLNVNRYNNPTLNTQPIINSNPNPGYVMVYSNGQLLKIPGVVVNSPQNNVPLQNGYPVQGTQYIVANSLPTNVAQNPTQNSGGHVIYATLPNQQSHGPIVLQIPNCVQNIPNNNVCGSGMVSQNPVQKIAPAGNSNQPIQNMGAQQAVLVQNGATSNYQGQNQALPFTNQPANSCSSGYNPPMTNQGGNVAVSAPNQGAVMTNQNTPLQQVVELPVNTGPNLATSPTNQGSQGANPVVNSPSHDEVAENNDNTDSYNSNMASIGAQPAIMISDFKDKVDKKDNKEDKSKKDKSKKKNEKK